MLNPFQSRRILVVGLSTCLVAWLAFEPDRTDVAQQDFAAIRPTNLQQLVGLMFRDRDSLRQSSAKLVSATPIKPSRQLQTGEASGPRLIAIVSFVVDSRGAPCAIQTEVWDPHFTHDDIARSVAQWSFIPAYRDGIPRASTLSIPLNAVLTIP